MRPLFQRDLSGVPVRGSFFQKLPRFLARQGNSEKGGGFLVGHGLCFRHNAFKDCAPDYKAVVTENLLNACVTSRYGGYVEADNLVLPVEGQALWLPCGTTARWQP